jgi:nicotinate-nucleotide adenylyltransferase
MRVGLFGGSFNPPHVAHVLAATYVLSIGEIDEVRVVPVFSHAFDKALAPFDDRVEMCRLALGWIPHVIVSDVERYLGTPSRTLHTVKHLLGEHPDWQLRLIVGSDVLAQVDQWHAFESIAEVAPPLVLGRAGAGEPNAPAPFLPNISSTELRRALARGNPADTALIEQLVPAAVRRYIQARALYR